MGDARKRGARHPLGHSVHQAAVNVIQKLKFGAVFLQIEHSQIQKHLSALRFVPPLYQVPGFSATGKSCPPCPAKQVGKKFSNLLDKRISRVYNAIINHTKQTVEEDE